MVPMSAVEELLPALKSCGLLAPLFQKQVLAIPVCPKAGHRLVPNDA